MADAGRHIDGVARGVDGPDGVHPRQRENDRVTGAVRHLPADQARVAALGHDRGSCLVRKLQDRLHLLDGPRPQHQGRGPEVTVARLDEVGLLVVSVPHRIGVPHDGREAGEKVGGRRGHGRFKS